MTRRIWDLFMFGGELDMLECRLRTLEGLDVRHVIAEADVTHQGHAKGYAYLEHVDRFAAWADRITYLQVSFRELPDGAWPREAAQRECLLGGLADAGPDDVVLLSDVDEIPRPIVLRAFLEPDQWGWPGWPAVLMQRQHVFAVDWQHPDELPGTVVVPAGQVGTLAGLREYNRRYGEYPRVADGGWHLSWLGGREAIDRKARLMMAHDEWRGPVVAANDGGRLYEGGWCPWDETQQAPVNVDASWPAWIAGRGCPGSWFRPRSGPG